MECYIREYNLCIGRSLYSTFEYKIYERSEIKINCSDIKLHALIFCIEGYLKVLSNLYPVGYLCVGEVIFIPRGCDYIGEALSETILLIHYFSIEACSVKDCTLFYLFARKMTKPMKSVFNKLSLSEGIKWLLRSIDIYMKDGIRDEHLDILKHRELIWLFSKYYPIEELRLFFSSLFDDAVPFKGVVLSHYRRVSTVGELAELCGYGVHTFRRVFAKEFGVSPYQWLIVRKAEHIKHRLYHSYVPFCDIMDEFHLSSHSNFTKFCKKYLGDTPTNLRAPVSKSKKYDCSE